MDKLNKLRTNANGMLVWAIISAIIISAILDGKRFLEVTLIQRIVLGILAVVLVFVAHESIHALFAKVFTRKKVKVTIKRINGYGVVPMTIFDPSGLKVWQLVVIHLAPLIMLTILLIILIPFIGNVKLGYSFYIVAIGNCAGCYKDILDSLYYILEKK